MFKKGNKHGCRKINNPIMGAINQMKQFEEFCLIGILSSCLILAILLIASRV